MASQLSTFLAELRRRRVFRVAVVYAGMAFIIFQIVDATFEPLNLPDWASTLVIVILVLGFPIAVALAWAFDLTAEGLVRAKVKREPTAPKAPHHIVIGNKTLAVIAALAIMLAAWSWWRTSQDPLSAFEHSVAVMPFDNLTGDETYDIWERGMVTLLFTSLTTSEELYVLDVQTLFEVIDAIKDAQRAQMIPQLATEVAHRTGVKNVILGDILQAGDRLRLQARLVDVKTGEVVYSPFVEGKSEDDFFAMAQDLADQLKNHLEIEVLAQVKKGYYATGYELDDVLTTSAQAFRHFLRRGDLSDPATQVKELTQAVSIDTNFVWAQLQLALAYNDYARLGNTAVRIKEARKWARKAYSRKNELPYRYQLMMEVFWCEFEKTPYEEIKWIKKALELNPQNWELWANLGHCWYYYLGQYDQAIEPYKKCIELRKQRGYGSKWEEDISNLRNIYHNLGEHDKELELIRGLDLPDTGYLAAVAAAYLCNGDTAGARTYLTRLQQRAEEQGATEAQSAAWFGSTYQRAGQLDRAEEFYRRAIALDPQGADIGWGYSGLNQLAHLLIENDRDVAEGVQLAQRALQVNSENRWSLHALGWGYYKQGRYAQAVEVLEQADDLSPDYVHQIRQHLEAARKALGREK